MPTGDPYNLTGQTKVSDAEAREHQATLLAKRITEIPSDLQVLIDYAGRTDGQPVYMGYGPKGLASNVTGWLLHKYTYNGSDQATSKKNYYGVYDDRASYTYE